ncbi:hypothetical protein P171DRAFT_457050 [Karstenula rhodostoma CBS 690.94]|uniref:Uncharacterized protein n=1 Tax=Karstenula rhodostoma CBS 690.94 TaxID=1392251 RepID=A0A9P4PA30_9PLEO|nr:hypothetical protein P171DRAFT_457050 [Karstenula rhodostoma CBS 690.94]
MSSDRSSPPLPSPGLSDRRRASVTGQTFRDIFGQSSAPVQSQPYPGPITTAAVNAQRRRLSLTTVGLSASPNQSSPFQTRPRTESLSSANSGSVDESPFEDDPMPSANSNPATPFARRLSFGARAMRDVRQSNGSVGNSNGRPSIHKVSSPPTARGRGLSSSTSTAPEPLSSHVQAATSESHRSERSPSFHSSSVSHVLAEHFKRHPDQAFGEHELTTMLSTSGEGYSFAENLRTRAERASVSGAKPMHTQPPPHQRAKSVAIMEPPVREMPKQPKVPDAMQERILKGDFYMD